MSARPLIDLNWLICHSCNALGNHDPQNRNIPMRKRVSTKNTAYASKEPRDWKRPQKLFVRPRSIRNLTTTTVSLRKSNSLLRGYDRNQTVFAMRSSAIVAALAGSSKIVKDSDLGEEEGFIEKDIDAAKERGELEFERIQTMKSLRDVDAENTHLKAIRSIKSAIIELVREDTNDDDHDSRKSARKGIVRVRCFVPRDCMALEMLSSLSKGGNDYEDSNYYDDDDDRSSEEGFIMKKRDREWENTTPRFYFSPRSPPPKPVRTPTTENRKDEAEDYAVNNNDHTVKDVNTGDMSKDSRGAMAAIGASCLWTSSSSSSLVEGNSIDDDEDVLNPKLLTKNRLRNVREFLKVSKSLKAFGAGRFDPDVVVDNDSKWKCFGSRYVFIPIVDVSESIVSGEVGANISWDLDAKENDGACAKTFDEAAENCLKCLSSIEESLLLAKNKNRFRHSSSSRIEKTTTKLTPSSSSARKIVSPDEKTWENVVSETLKKMNKINTRTNDEEDDIKLLLGTSFDEDAFADIPAGNEKRLRSALKNMGRRSGINADESILDVFENLVNENKNNKPDEDDEDDDEDTSTTGATLQELPDDDSPQASDDDDEDNEDFANMSGRNTKTGKRSLRKVVLARKTTLNVSSSVSEYDLIQSLQRRDPDAYQFILTHPSGASFIGSSPERLFKSNISMQMVESEAVAGTRSRGSDPGEDAALAYDMLLSEKEHEEFAIVREDVRKSLAQIARKGDAGVFKELEKGILRHVSVQHLYARFRADLDEDLDESDIIRTLHPTPAVCGYPRDLALQTVRKSETFDRGLYAGPLGWIDSEGAEFCVAIRSALLSSSSSSSSDNDDDDMNSTKIAELFAGVGVVKAANAKSEWKELNLKTKPMEALLMSNTNEGNNELSYKTNNPNARAAYALVDELVSNGVELFCIAPGSRSTPLALAAENHPSAKVIVCIDERSLGFYALGFGKGAGKPCAIIVSSGTAVANLLPSFVEAHESQTPAIFLTADRPHELRDTGANQTIDQIDMFKNFRRYFVDAPVPGDLETSEMQSSTFRSVARVAYGKATDSSHPGPVHINLPFRDPLGPMQNVESNSNNASDISSKSTLQEITLEDEKMNSSSGDSLEIQDFSVFESAVERMKKSKKGVLVIGGSASSKDALMSAKCAKLLGWAVLADVTSGLRVGVDSSDLNIVKCFDYLLCSSEAVERFSPDCIVQLGSRIVSKRLCKFIDDAAKENNASFIVVDPSPRNFDPSHVVTHRIQCSRDVFATELRNHLSSLLSTEQRSYAQAFVTCGKIVANAVSRRIFKMDEQNGITEMSVAAEICNALPKSSGLFLGNSMPIRDADALAGIEMFSSSDNSNDHVSKVTTTSLGNPVIANRGASGIDGIISTAAGYACGLNRPVTLFIGDVSFQHDSNGLLFLRERPGQPPVTIVVVNNGGGGIFGFLPVSTEIDRGTFEKLFATPPDASRRLLCEANRVAFAHPRSMHSFSNELATSYGEGRHRVIEVSTSRPQNLDEHKSAQRQAVSAAEHFLKMEKDIIKICPSPSSLVVKSVSVRPFEESLRIKDTTTSEQKSRRGYLLELTLGDLSRSIAVGYGECSPLPGLHDETECAFAGAQLQAFCETMLLEKVVPASLTSLHGQFAKWFSEEQSKESLISGNEFNVLFPSVRFCIEMAVLNALGDATSSRNPIDVVDSKKKKIVSVNCLFDPDLTKTDEENAEQLRALFQENPYKCVKVKVGRDENVLRDASRLKAFRKILGADVEIRADANRAWSLKESIVFGKELERLQDVNLQFIEEPTKSEKDLEEFFLNTNIFYALDETVDLFIRGNPSGDIASSFYKSVLRNRLGCAAVILKPSVVGGVEITRDLCETIVDLSNAVPIISSAFDSPVSMTMNAKIAETLLPENDGAKISTTTITSHGLDTGRWFANGNLNATSKKGVGEECFVGIDSDSFEKDVAQVWAQSVFSLEENVVKIKEYNISIERKDEEGFSHDISIDGYFPPKEVSSSTTSTTKKGKTLVFLHGFMGDKSDWNVVAKSIALLGHTCVAIDLPGHGKTTTDLLETRTTTTTSSSKIENTYSIEGISKTVNILLEKMDIEDVVVVGYSLGARVALSLLNSERISQIISLSGTCGMLDDDDKRESRRLRDEELASNLRNTSMLSFCTTWYAQPMWKSLREKNMTSAENNIAKRRSDAIGFKKDEIANVLEHASVGKQKNTWAMLRNTHKPCAFVYGELDDKFARIAEKACKNNGSMIKAIKIEKAGHAIHLERAHAVTLELSKLLL